MAAETGRHRIRRGVRRAAVRVAVSVVAVSVFAVVGNEWATWRGVEAQLTTLPADLLDGLVDRPARAAAAGAQDEPTTVLLIGADKAAGETLDQAKGASDTVMLLHFNAARTRADALSLPRDAVLGTPDRGPMRVGAMLPEGGVPLVVATVEKATGVRIDHITVGDLSSIGEITTEVGGVQVNNVVAGTDPLTGRHYPVGALSLSGDEALTWARWINGLQGGDLERIVHQHQLLNGVRAKLGGWDLAKDPGVLGRVAATFTRHLTVDADLDLDTATALFGDLAQVPADRLRYYTAPLDPSGLRLDEARLKDAGTALNEDRDLPLTATIVP
ncbi:LCP family protein [Actinosynnema sp. NPDC020468]|uniref:LCP family protein n=1 Tax=Actinosynnema sp. NPDC020468 TaxID=3154488 RepID=UPI0033FAE7D8